jgi:hypothetical protein
MKRASITAIFKSDIQKVWNIVTDNQNCSWRSDLSRIEILDDGKTFVEYAKGGFPTTFVITQKKPFEGYEFDIKNKNMSGHWVGKFTKKQDSTEIEFVEEIVIKNPVMNLFAGAYLKKQQKTYVADLRKALGE